MMLTRARSRQLSRQGPHGYNLRDRSITDFFKPTQKPDRGAFDAPPRGNIGNESAKLLSSGVESRGIKKACPAKPRRRKIPVRSPSRSPIMEAFLRRAREERNDLVSTHEKSCAKCHMSLISPKVVIQKLFLPSNSLSFDVVGKEGTRKLKCGLNGNVTKSVCSEGHTTEPVLSGKSHSNSSSYSLVPDTGASKMNDQCIGYVSRTPMHQLIKRSPRILITPLASKFQATLEINRKENVPKKEKMRRNQQTFSPGRTGSGSDEVKNQVNRTILSNRSSSSLLEPDSESDIRRDHSSVRKRKLFSPTCMNTQIPTDGRCPLSLRKRRRDLNPRACKSGGQQNNGRSEDLGEQLKVPHCALPLDKGKSSPMEKPLFVNSTSNSAYENEENCFSFINDSHSALDESDQTHKGLLEESASCLPAGSINQNSVLGTNSALLNRLDSSPDVSPDTLPTVASSESELSSDSSSSFTDHRRKQHVNGQSKRRYSFDSDQSIDTILSSDDEEILKPLDEIMHMASKSPAATPEKSCRELRSSQLSLSQSPVKKSTFEVPNPATYVNNLEQLLKEKKDCQRLDEMEKKLQEEIQRGMGMICSEAEESADDEGELLEEHKAFLQRFSVVANAIPDLNPGQEIFDLAHSGVLFNHHTLDLKNFGFTAEIEEERIILSCEKTHQLMLATGGFLCLVYRLRKCPVAVLEWLFQMMTVQPGYIVSVQILQTLIDITLDNFTTRETHGTPWIPSLLNVATVFMNMGVNFQTLFPLQHLQPGFRHNDIVSPMQVCFGQEEPRNVHSGQVFTKIAETRITSVIKFLGMCTTLCTESYSDQEIVLLSILLFKIHLDNQLRQIPPVDLYSLLTNLFTNIRDWETKMPELCLAIGELATHHHDLLKLVQLVPTSHSRGRQLRRHLSLVIISKLMDETCTSIPLDYDLQMTFLCRCLAQMKPSALVKKMEKGLSFEKDATTHQELEQEAYYLTYSLLNLVNEASCSDASPSVQRKYLKQLCVALEKHVKCDIRETARLLYRTKVKDLVARIYGKWQELLHFSQPNQGKLHDYWEPVSENQNPVPDDECITSALPNDEPCDMEI
ncbi:SMC5-SMC6 complex localization factor protein 2-like isoform X2 [Ascaphus truei]|uniref:SMC5-SMC6 complex localization factor protein 2-like isoform X2 n=1 Tax=Ascaphus truei TaxID=8439 RepID=UPI003F595DBE